jgi:hypothetical protein
MYVFEKAENILKCMPNADITDFSCVLRTFDNTQLLL